jgi:hypothetical protein
MKVLSFNRIYNTINRFSVAYKRLAYLRIKYKADNMLVQIRPESSEETRNKLRELTLYVAKRCETDPNFGATKLNKIILFADVYSHLRYGSSITGSAYMKQKYGPVPLHMIQVIEKMVIDRDIVMRREPVSIQHVQTKIIPLREANVDIFLPRDIALVEDVIHNCISDNAKSISDKSHGLSWQLSKLGDIIPYDSFLISDDQTPTDADIEEARQMITKHGWEVYATS